MSYRPPRHHTLNIASGDKITTDHCTKLDGTVVGFKTPGELDSVTFTFRVAHRPDGYYGPVHNQDETSYDNTPTTEGTFAVGTGHDVDDVLTLSDGTLVTVVAVDTGEVTEFTVDASTSGGADVGDVLEQTASTGSGTGFSLTLDADNVVRGAWPVLMDSEGNVPSVTVVKSKAYTLVGSEADAIGPWPYFKLEGDAAESADRVIEAVTR